MQTKAKWNMIVWKQALMYKVTYDLPRSCIERCLVKLRIPKGTCINLKTTPSKYRTKKEITGAIHTRKSRAKTVEVLGIFTLKGQKLKQSLAYAHHDESFCYKVGQKKTVENYCISEDICAEGIHFFKDREDAANYAL